MQYFTVFIPIHLITLNKPSSSIEGGVMKHFKKKRSDIMYRPPKVRPKSNNLEGGTIPGTFPWSIIMKKENGVIQCQAYFSNLGTTLKKYSISICRNPRFEESTFSSSL